MTEELTLTPRSLRLTPHFAGHKDLQRSLVIQLFIQQHKHLKPYDHEVKGDTSVLPRASTGQLQRKRNRAPTG